MARRTHDYRLKRAISTRLQLIIEERFDSLYGFSQAMEGQGKTALASTVRGWLPPQKLWKAKPNGRAVRRVDWEAVKVPDCSTLIEFCDLLSVRTDYILLGEGVASRSQTRELELLEADIAAHLAEALQAQGFSHWSAAKVDGAAVLAASVEDARKEAAFYNRLVETAPGRIAARSGLLLDVVGQLARHLPETPEVIAKFLMLSHTSALLEASVGSDFDFKELRTRYLTFPDFNPDDLVLPRDAMDAQMSAALQRTEQDTQQKFELSKGDGARIRRMLSNARRLVAKSDRAVT
jgi:hypothetical protein